MSLTWLFNNPVVLLGRLVEFIARPCKSDQADYSENNKKMYNHICLIIYFGFLKYTRRIPSC